MPIKDPEARRAYNKEYAQKNKETAYQRVKEWRAKNPEKVADQQKRYAQKYPEKLVAKSQRWQNNNPEKFAETSRNTRKKNAARVLANKAKYRAIKLNATPKWLNEGDWLEIKSFYVYRNALKQIGLNYHVDHIVPLQGKNVSGLHVPENLQVILAKQNRLKSNNYVE